MALLRPPGGTPPSPLIDEAAVKAAMNQAGLEPVETGEFAADLAFPGANKAVRANLAAG